MKRIVLLISFLTGSLSSILGQGTTGGVKGTVKDATGKPVPFANVVLLQGTRQVAGAPTDFEGIYSMTSVPVGTYDMQVSAVGFTTKKLTNIVVSGSKITFQDVVLAENPQNLQVVDVEAVKDPLIKKDDGTQGANIQREDVLKLPARDPINAALIVGG
ncbi:MAG: carboxypeptidase-like regulatory domain-containing protein, partial [Flavobacteriales bacterium]|nr:carboxypeptidase-like regulatory domain-containing protein [Flavobacteriales bacterium]